MKSFIVTSDTRKCRVYADTKDEALSIAVARGAKGKLTARKSPEKTSIPLQRFSQSSDKNSCTVIATSVALGIGYPSAHRLLQVYGRKNGHGFHFAYWIGKEGKHLFDELVQYARKWDWSLGRRIGITVGQFIKEHPKGIFIVQTEGHVFTIVDGVSHDTFRTGPKTRLHRVWTVVSHA